MRIADLSGSLAVFMFIGFILGLIFGDPTGISGPLSMILLGVMMTLSMSDMTLELGERKKTLVDGLVPALLSFGLLTPVFIVASFFFDGEMRLGWMLAAAMPAAVAIVPYSERFKGDVKLALHGEIAIYIIALGLTPAIAAILLNTSVAVIDLLAVLLTLIIVPLVLSRVAKRIKIKANQRNIIMNLTFLFFSFIVVGANRGIFFGEITSILMLTLMSLVTVFGTGLIVDYYLEKRKSEPEKRTLTMFSTLKNTGLAIAVALSISRPEMAVPATMLVIFEMIWVIFLSFGKYNNTKSLP